MCALSFEKFTHQAEPFAQGLLDAVYAMSKDPVAGVSRQGYSALETKVLACLTDRVAALKLEVEQDPAGNVCARHCFGQPCRQCAAGRTL